LTDSLSFQSSILEEALNCTVCHNLHLSPIAMESDIEHGIYRCADDPPFSVNKDEDVAPDEMPTQGWEPGYRRHASIAQQERYLQRVEQTIEHNRAHKLDRGIDDMGYMSKFAFYCVDHHIHQHRLARRSALNLCRQAEEMEDYRLWRAQVHLADNSMRQSTLDILNDMVAEANPSSPTTIVWPPALPFTTTTSSSRWGPQINMKQQMALFRRLSSQKERSAHVRAVKKRFRATMQERADQRRDGLIIARFEAAKTLFNWKQGRPGPLAQARDDNITAVLNKYHR
jgi:hypothetical protein